MTSSQADVIQKLSSRIRRMEHSRLDHFQKSREGIVSTGVNRLDSLLPNKGLLRGTLTEWIAADAGCGALTLAILAMIGAQRTAITPQQSVGNDKRKKRKQSRQSRADSSPHTAAQTSAARIQPVIIIDPQQSFYLPAAVAYGLNARHTILIRPQSADDAMWALEQSLRHTGPAAVLCRIEREGRQWNDQVFRRLQLACETGNSLGLLIRPDSARQQTCWAEVRFRVTSVLSQPKPTADYLPARATQPGPALNVVPHAPSPERSAGHAVAENSAEYAVQSEFSLGTPTAEPVRHHMSRRINIELMSAKGRMTPQTVPLEICDATGRVRVAAKLRHAAISERTRRTPQPALRAV